MSVRVGLVLGAGGVTGDAFHRGVLRALWDRGYDARSAEVIVGTSAGSMVGALLRRPDAPPGRAPDETATVHGGRLSRWPDPSPLLAALRRPWQARAGVLLTSLLPTGRHSTEFLVSSVRHHHGDRWPDRPLWVVAVRRRDGRRVVFGRDGAPATDLPHAVAASCAIPGYFHPVEIDGETYVDGGVHSPTNADLLREAGLDVVIASSPMSVDPRDLGLALDVPLRLAFHRMLQRELRTLRRAGVRTLQLEPGGDVLGAMGVNALHGGRIDRIERLSAIRAGEALDAAPDLLDALRGRGRRPAA